MATTFADILRQQQMLQQQGQEAQQSQGQGMAQLGQLGGKQLASALRGGGGAAASPGGAGFGLGQPLVSGQMGASSMAGGGAASGGGGMGSALMSNPWTAAAAAIVGGSNYLHNKDISPWNETLKGQAGGNMLDYYGGRKDGKTHGAIGKIVDKDGATGQSLKAVTDLSELDFSNAWKNAKDSVKSLFKLKLF